MKFPASYINEIARVTGFDPANTKKVLRLKELLRELDRHSFLKGKLVLKGGTGINVFYLGLPRLSVDIDLNYVGQAELEPMRAERPQVERAVEQVCRGLGYEIRPGTNEHALFQIYLGFRNHAGRQDQIELEINFLMRICALPAPILEGTRLGDEESCRFPVLAVEELVAGKVKALIERRHPRDLYDVYRFVAAQISHDGELLKKLSVLFGSTLDRDLGEYTVERLEAITQSEVERLLYPLLRADDRPTVAQMMATSRPLLSSFFDHKKQRAYLEAMTIGEYRPEPLFPKHPELAARLTRCPESESSTFMTRLYASEVESATDQGLPSRRYATRGTSARPRCQCCDTRSISNATRVSPSRADEIEDILCIFKDELKTVGCGYLESDATQTHAQPDIEKFITKKLYVTGRLISNSKTRISPAS